MTCNYLDKLIEPIRSRFIAVQVRYSMAELGKRIITILDEDGVKYGKEELSAFFKDVVKKVFPDFRQILLNLDIRIHDGILMKDSIIVADNESIPLTIAEMIRTKKLPKDIRGFYIENEDAFFGDYEQLASQLFNHMYDFPNYQIIVGESLRWMSQVLDKEIEFYHMILQICTK